MTKININRYQKCLPQDIQLTLEVQRKLIELLRELDRLVEFDEARLERMSQTWLNDFIRQIHPPEFNLTYFLACLVWVFRYFFDPSCEIKAVEITDLKLFLDHPPIVYTLCKAFPAYHTEEERLPSEYQHQAKEYLLFLKFFLAQGYELTAAEYHAFFYSQLQREFYKYLENQELLTLETFPLVKRLIEHELNSSNLESLFNCARLFTRLRDLEWQSTTFETWTQQAVAYVLKTDVEEFEVFKRAFLALEIVQGPGQIAVVNHLPFLCLCEQRNPGHGRGIALLVDALATTDLLPHEYHQEHPVLQELVHRTSELSAEGMTALGQYVHGCLVSLRVRLTADMFWLFWPCMVFESNAYLQDQRLPDLSREIQDLKIFRGRLGDHVNLSSIFLNWREINFIRRARDIHELPAIRRLLLLSEIINNPLRAYTLTEYQSFRYILCIAYGALAERMPILNPDATRAINEESDRRVVQQFPTLMTSAICFFEELRRFEPDTIDLFLQKLWQNQSHRFLGAVGAFVEIDEICAARSTIFPNSPERTLLSCASPSKALPASPLVVQILDRVLLEEAMLTARQALAEWSMFSRAVVPNASPEKRTLSIHPPQ